MTNLQRFDKFLRSVDLEKYRIKYRPITLVEMDLPKNVQAIKLLYQIYWQEKRFIDFNDFFKEYLKAQKNEIETFRNKIGMCAVCFGKGLPARIYRTWASLITQIHAGYVAESVFGPGTIEMSEELDHNGADFQVKYRGKVVNYQVKKTSFSSEVRRGKGGVKNKIAGEFKDINYEVPASEYFINKRKKDGEYRLPYLRFIENKELKRFPNGFVVFTEETFIPKKLEIDRASKKK